MKANNSQGFEVKKQAVHLAGLASLSILNYELYPIISQLLSKNILDCGVMFAMPNAVAGTNVVLCKMYVGMYMMILEKVNI